MNHGGDLLPLLPGVIEAGGHVSIGLGDWPYLELASSGESPTNAEVVAAVSNMSRSDGREVATPSEAAQVLGAAI